MALRFHWFYMTRMCENKAGKVLAPAVKTRSKDSEYSDPKVIWVPLGLADFKDELLTLHTRL